jgi:solute carrier family 35 protein F1/2
MFRCTTNKDNINLNTSSTKTTRKRKKKKNKHSLSVILFGQTIALALACGNAASSTLENKYQIRIPIFLTGFVYLVLSFHMVYLFVRRRRKSKDDGEGANCDNTPPPVDVASIELQETITEHNSTILCDECHVFPFTNLRLNTPWCAYLLLAILDVEANYLAMLSFQHTSLSSSMLLTSLSVISTMFLRRCIFGIINMYSWRRISGVLICLLGGCLWMWQDFYTSVKEKYSLDDGSVGSVGVEVDKDFLPDNHNNLYGDALALAAAFLYGLNDVLLEYTVKANNDRVEYLGTMGSFGFLFSLFVQAPILERDKVVDMVSTLSNYLQGMDGNDDDVSVDMDGVVMCILCFVSMLSCFYISVTVFLSSNDATILNLSLQTCPLWAVVITMFLQGEGWSLPPLSFFVALALVMTGMFLYESQSETEDATDGICSNDELETAPSNDEEGDFNDESGQATSSSRCITDT